MLHNLCKTENPDIVIGTSMGGMFTQQMHGFKKIIVNPAFHVSQTLRRNIGTQKFLNPRVDGIMTFEITPQLCEEYAEMESKQFEGITTIDKEYTATTDSQGRFIINNMPDVGDDRLLTAVITENGRTHTVTDIPMLQPGGYTSGSASDPGNREVIILLDIPGITGSAVAQSYAVTYTLTNTTAVLKPASVVSGTRANVRLRADSGYVLPDDIEVKMGGSALESGTGYTYDQATGKIVVTGVSAAVAITAVAVPDGGRSEEHTSELQSPSENSYAVFCL